jgi:hypothetical protein
MASYDDDDFDWNSIFGGGGGGGGEDSGYEPGEPGYERGGSTPWWDSSPNPSGTPFGMSDRGAGDPFGKGGGGGDSGALAGLAKLFGVTGKDGSINLSSLLPLIAGLGGGIYSLNTRKGATKDMTDAYAKANDIITSTLGGNKDLYAPWHQAGLDALSKVQAMPPSNLSAGFGPLAAGFGPLAAGFGPLAGNYKPLGSGRGLTLSQMAKGR